VLVVIAFHTTLGIGVVGGLTPLSNDPSVFEFLEGFTEEH
jgi:hypothetical protein